MKKHYIQIKLTVYAGDNITKEDMKHFVEDLFPDEYRDVSVYKNGVIEIDGNTKPELVMW